ncbi:MAG: hypothetical protein RRY33_07295, partial [Alistipes sp.]
AMYPDVVGTQGVIEGFTARKIYQSYTIHYQERHIVTLVDPNPKAEWVAQLPRDHMTAYRLCKSVETIGGLYVTGHNNDSFYIQVYSTGPGDEDVHSQIEIGMSKIEGGVCMVDKTKPYLTIPITITTSCVIGYAQSKGTTFFDRDSGAPTPDVFPKPLCFIFYGINPINLPWRGDDWTFKQIQEGKVFGTTKVFPCDAKYTDGTDNWCAPAQQDITNMINVLSCSKGRPFILSEQKNAAGKYVGSFLSYEHQRDGYPTDWPYPKYNYGGYYKAGAAQRLVYVTGMSNCGSALVNYDGREYPGRVRCVKKTEVKP